MGNLLAVVLVVFGSYLLALNQYDYEGLTALIGGLAYLVMSIDFSSFYNSTKQDMPNSTGGEKDCECLHYLKRRISKEGNDQAMEMLAELNDKVFRLDLNKAPRPTENAEVIT